MSGVPRANCSCRICRRVCNLLVQMLSKSFQFDVATRKTESSDSSVGVADLCTLWVRVASGPHTVTQTLTAGVKRPGRED